MAISEDLLHTYELLPNLLADLSTLVKQSSRWNAQIYCAGDQHQLNFNNNSCIYSLTANSHELKSTYENMAELMTELDYIKEYFSLHENELGPVKMSFEVNANGGHPSMKIECNSDAWCQIKNRQENTQENTRDRHFPSKNRSCWDWSLHIGFESLVLLGLIYPPVFIIHKYYNP